VFESETSNSDRQIVRLKTATKAETKVTGWILPNQYRYASFHLLFSGRTHQGFCLKIKFNDTKQNKETVTIDQFRYIKIQPVDNRPQHEALGNNYRVCGVYSPEPPAEVKAEG